MNSFYDFIDSDDALFHYTTLGIGLEKILKKKRIRLSALNRTDDPQEYNDWSMSLVGWPLPDDNMMMPKYSEAYTRFNTIIKKKSFLLCFCQNSSIICANEIIDDKDGMKLSGYQRSRMWSQYGDHHKGICLVFSKKLLEKKVKAVFGDRVKIGEVDYPCEDSINYKALVFDGNVLKDKSVEETVDLHIETNYKNIFYTKNIDYRDESEYRIVIIDKAEENEYKEIDVDECLVGIVLGNKLPEVYYPSIREACKSEIRRLYWRNGRFIPIGI